MDITAALSPLFAHQETVRFRMQFESLNTSILKTPYLKGVPLEGVVQVKEPNWKSEYLIHIQYGLELRNCVCVCVCV